MSFSLAAYSNGWIMTLKGYVLITGVSTGIGNSLAKTFVKEGYFVFGSVRSAEDAKSVELEIPGNFAPLIFDVTSKDQIQEALHTVSSICGDNGLNGLVNNSGIAIGGPLELMEMDEIKHHFEVNVFGLIQVTKLFLPLIKKASGIRRIINVGSVSGQVTAPFIGPYVASKHALEGLSGSWRKELMLFDIDMILIGPGSVRTPIWNKGKSKTDYADSAYAKSFTKFAKYVEQSGARGEDVNKLSRQILQVFTVRKPRTRYAFVKGKLTHWLIPKWLPASYYDHIVGKILGLNSNK